MVAGKSAAAAANLGAEWVALDAGTGVGCAGVGMAGANAGAETWVVVTWELVRGLEGVGIVFWGVSWDGGGAWGVGRRGLDV